MADMAREFFARSPYLMGPVVALVLFIVMFAVVVARTYSRKASELDAIARLPLADDTRKGASPHE